MSAPFQAQVAVEVPPQKRAVLYLRVSTEEQADTDYNAEGYSLPAQREACQRLADQLDAIVVGEYVDRGESAKSAKRPELQRMLTRLREQSDIDYVIVHKVDRLARNRRDDVEIDLVIRAAGARLASASENIDDTPHGKLIRNIMADFAQYYSDNLATEAKKGARQKAKFGGTPYKPPIGYLVGRERIEGREIRIVTTDLDRAPLVRWAFRAYATGNYTMQELAEELEQRGLRYEPSRKLSSRPMAKNAVNNMLRNRYYLGMVSYEGVLYQGRHEPLVDEATFEAVQAIMAARVLSGEKPKQRPHYLKGRLFCGYCGTRLGISFARNHQGKHYPYFYCIGRQKRKNCPQTFVPIAVIEAAAVDYWRRHVRLDEQRSAEVRQVVAGWLLARQLSSGKTITAQRKRIEKLEREQAKLTQAYLADALSLDALKTEQARVQRELGQARSLIGQYQQDYQALEAALDHALLLCRSGALAYEHAESEVKRQLIQAAFDKLWVVGTEIAGADLKSGFVTLLDDELVAELEQKTVTPGSEQANKPLEGRSEGTTYYREDGSFSLDMASLELTGVATAEEDLWLSAERPSGRLPWEAKDPTTLCGVRGLNVDGLVELRGLEPLTPCLQSRCATSCAIAPDICLQGTSGCRQAWRTVLGKLFLLSFGVVGLCRQRSADGATVSTALRIVARIFPSGLPRAVAPWASRVLGGYRGCPQAGPWAADPA
jgi:site-specific DNA recombinase